MKPRQAAVIFILVTVTLDMLAIGLIAPVLPKLVLDFLGGDAPGAAKMFGIFGTVFALMQFVFSPVLGVLSDRFGRRPVILLSNLGLGLDYIVMALAPTLGWLFLGRVISGITAASGLWHDRRGVRRRLCSGTGAWWFAGELRSAAAVLGRGGIEPGKRDLW